MKKYFLAWFRAYLELPKNFVSVVKLRVEASGSSR